MPDGLIHDSASAHAPCPHQQSVILDAAASTPTDRGDGEGMVDSDTDHLPNSPLLGEASAGSVCAAIDTARSVRWSAVLRQTDRRTSTLDARRRRHSLAGQSRGASALPSAQGVANHPALTLSAAHQAAIGARAPKNGRVRTLRWDCVAVPRDSWDFWGASRLCVGKDG